jgi:NhaP-type Na+/H+ or K+/H+ antiporter
VTRIVDDIEGAALGTLAAEAALVAVVVIAIRMAWSFTVAQSGGARERLVVGWSGMRGAVSLAAALAIPIDDFPDRDLIIFLAYGAVLVTLVLPGLTLAPLIARLDLSQSAERRRQEVEARLRLTHAALERLDDMAEHGEADAFRLRYKASVGRDDHASPGAGDVRRPAAGRCPRSPAARGPSRRPRTRGGTRRARSRARGHADPARR